MSAIPVHREMTAAALALAGLPPLDGGGDDEVGVLWNDDPALFLTLGEAPFDLARWQQEFNHAFRALAPAAPGPGAPLHERLRHGSHYGEMQYLHAMANRDGERADTTLARIMAWAEAMFGVFRRQLPPETPLGELAVTGFTDPALAGLTLKTLLGPGCARVALGSVLHIVQDSHAPCHVERTGGVVVRFLSYTHQDPERHAHTDQWPQGLDPRHPRGPNPISQCTTLLRLAHGGAAWPEVAAFLRQEVLPLADPAAPAGPGEGCR